MINFTIAIPCLGKLAALKGCVASVLGTLAHPEQTELILFDQDPSDRWGWWARKYLSSMVGRLVVMEAPGNAGLPKAHNRMASVATGTSKAIAYLHNDVLIYDKGWDTRVLQLFEAVSKVGVIGFAGARGVGANGSRYEFWSNMLEAEIHGSRGYNVLPVAMLDGFSLIVNRELLKTVGWDESYPIHHYYDYDICTTAHSLGWRNLLCGVRCHHLSGITNAGKAYNDHADRLTGAAPGQGGAILLEQARQRYLTKFGRMLPLFVEDWYNR